jgi:hypothetical protein
LADLGHVSKREEKRRFVQKAIRTGRATVTRRRRQAAVRLPFNCAHRIAMQFCESPLRLVHGRRTSCVDRVPSATKRISTGRSKLFTGYPSTGYDSQKCSRSSCFRTFLTMDYIKPVDGKFW